MKPYVGQVVQYKYKPDSNTPPDAAVVTKVHDDKWVSLCIFRDPPQYPTHVEFERHCKVAAEPSAATYMGYPLCP